MVHPTNVILVGESIGENIKNNLIPSWLSFVVQLAAFAVLLIVVIFLAYKPVKKMLKKRADFIEQNINDAQKNKAIAEKNALESQEAIIASKKEAASIIEAANKAASVSGEAIIEEAKLEAARIKANAEDDIERSKQEALESIHDEMVDVALSASSEILKREITSEDNERLAKEFIERL